MELLIVLVLLVVPVVSGTITKNIAAGKGRDTSGERTGWFLLGFFFPILGPIASLIVSPRPTQSSH